MNAAAVRWIGFFMLWLALEGTFEPAALVLGAATAAAAAWISLQLAPADGDELRWRGLLVLAPVFVFKSVAAGIDVARRALAFPVRLDPGLVTYRGAPPRGDARNRYALFTSLMPGTLPVAEDADSLVYHCLDVGEPVERSLADDQRLLQRTRKRARDE